MVRKSGARSDIQAGELATLDGRVTTVEDDLDFQAEELATLDGRITTVEDDQDILLDDWTALEARVTTTEGTLGEQAAALAALDGRLIVVEDDYDIVETTLESLDGRLIVVEDDLDMLPQLDEQLAQLAQLAQGQQTLVADLGFLQCGEDGVCGSEDDLLLRVGTLESTVSTLSSSIDPELVLRVDALELGQDDLAAVVAALECGADGQCGSDDDLVVRVEALEDDTTWLEEQVLALWAQVFGGAP